MSQQTPVETDPAAPVDSPAYRAKLHTHNPQSYFEGEVRGSHFHVDNVVDNGISSRSMPGGHPDNVRPIALAKIHALGHRLERLS